MKPTYRLLLTPRSPFARRVRLALSRLEIPFELEEVNIFQPNDALFKANPLAMVPILRVLNTGVDLIDSATILEYLHETYGEKIWPVKGDLRTQIRIASTWAEGILTYCVTNYLEGMQKVPDEEWREDWVQTVRRTVGRISESDPLSKVWVGAGGKPTQAGWDLGVTLEYLTLRMPQVDWAKMDSKFTKLLEICRKEEAFRVSTPPPQT